MVIYENALEKAANEDPLTTALTVGMNANPTGGIVATVGRLAAIGSIPLFIASGKNKRKASAISTSFKMENMRTIERTAIVHRSYPAIALKISL